MICVFPHVYYISLEMLKLLGAIIISHKLQEEANADTNENFFFQKKPTHIYIKSKQIWYLLAFAEQHQVFELQCISYSSWKESLTTEHGLIKSLYF